MILAILQARMSSTRLPGKVMKPILGKPMLAYQIERILRVKTIDKLVVATSVNIEDDAIASLCRDLNVECFRGSLDNVIDRFYQAAKLYSPTHVLRFTGDCPLSDPEIVERLIKFHLQGDYDYTSNALEPTYPDGLDVEMMKFSALAEAWKESTTTMEKEHVTFYLYNHPERFKIGVEKNVQDLSCMRWTVDEPEDYILIETIFRNLYPQNACFLTKDVLNFLEDYPEMNKVNARYQRNEGLEK